MDSVQELPHHSHDGLGNRFIRAALYLPALTAIRWEPNVKAFYEKLIARKKAPLQHQGRCRRRDGGTAMPAALTPGVIPWESIGMAAADVTKPLAGTVPTPADDYDTPWKDVSGRFFPQLVEFFAPDLYAIIDWSAGYEFLEQELRAMLRDAETGPRRVDKVVKVRTLAGQPLYLVLHVEIQP
jgi:hypothetical protein